MSSWRAFSPMAKLNWKFIILATLALLHFILPFSKRANVAQWKFGKFESFITCSSDCCRERMRMEWWGEIHMETIQFMRILMKTSENYCYRTMMIFDWLKVPPQNLQVCINLYSQEYLAKFLHYPHTTSLSFSSPFSLVYTLCSNVLNFAVHIFDTKLHFANIAAAAAVLTIWYSSSSLERLHLACSVLWPPCCGERERAKHTNKWMETLDFLTAAPERHCFGETTDYGSSSRKNREMSNWKCWMLSSSSEAGCTIKRDVAAWMSERSKYIEITLASEVNEMSQTCGAEDKSRTQQSKKKCLIEDNYVMYHVFVIPSILLNLG